MSQKAMSQDCPSQDGPSRDGLSHSDPSHSDPSRDGLGVRSANRSAPSSPARKWSRWLLRRWPVALAVALHLLTLSDPADVAGTVTGLGEALLLLPLLYLVMAKLRRRDVTWPAVVVLAGGLTALAAADLVPLPVGAIAVALGVLVWGAARGRLRRGDTFSAQAVGMLVFGAFALVGLAVDPAVGLYLVAAGWLLHGVWDFVYLRLDRVVSRSYAEWCGVIDILIAAELLLLAVRL
jgi:hypothetical protein